MSSLGLTAEELRQIYTFATLLYRDLDEQKLRTILDGAHPIETLQASIQKNAPVTNNVPVDSNFNKLLSEKSEDSSVYYLNNQYGNRIVVLAPEAEEKGENPNLIAINRILANFGEPLGKLIESIKMLPGVRSELREITPDAFFGDTEEWVRNFKVKLRELFEKSNIDVKTLERVTIPKYMRIWLQAFTHETYAKQNYEELEYMGDCALKLIFPKYLLERNPKLRKNELTNLNSRYMSKKEGYQGRLADRMGLRQFIESRIKGAVSLKITTDIFESFFGAVLAIGDDIKFGSGYIIGYQLLKYAVGDDKFKDVSADAKTQVEQIFKRFTGMKIAISTHIESFDALEDGTTRCIVKIPKENADFFRAVSGGYRDFKGNVVGGAIDIKELELANVTMRGKDMASNTAYIAALKKLEGYGLTTSVAETIKHKLEFLLDPEIKSKYLSVKEKMTKRGYVSFHFFSSGKVNNRTGGTTQLIGVSRNGEATILGTHTGNKMESRRALVADFLAG